MEWTSSALTEFEKIVRQAEGKRIVIFLDYDGTLTPIVDTPDQAIMHENVRTSMIELSRHCLVGVISGRDLEEVRERVKIESLIYAGSHGFDIAGPDGCRIENQVGIEFLPVLDGAEKELSDRLSSIQGILIERKKFAIAIHYRLVDPGKVEKIKQIVDEVALKYPGLRKACGKKVFELQPDIDWDKGKAILSLLHLLRLDGEEVLPFYIGDDVTDEDAFRALRGRGIGIVVQEKPYETSANYRLRDPDEVHEFLLRLITLFRRSV